jgi:hypothetical protein
MGKRLLGNALFNELKSKPALHPERRSLVVILVDSALVAYRLLDRRVDADVAASGLIADLAVIPSHLPVPLQFARPGARRRRRLGRRFRVGPPRSVCTGRPIRGD